MRIVFKCDGKVICAITNNVIPSSGDFVTHKDKRYMIDSIEWFIDGCEVPCIYVWCLEVG